MKGSTYGKAMIWLLAATVLYFAWIVSAKGQTVGGVEWDRNGDRLVITAVLNSPDSLNPTIVELGKDLAMVGAPGSEIEEYLDAHHSRKLVVVFANAEDGN